MSTAVQVWALAEVRGTCSGSPKSRKLATDHGEPFRARIVELSRRMDTHIIEKYPTGFTYSVEHRLRGHLLALKCSCCLCLSACRSFDGSHRLPGHLVLMLECSCSRVHARARVPSSSCSCASARVLVNARVLVCSRSSARPYCFVLVLEHPRARDRARVFVLERSCSSFRARARALLALCSLDV